MPNIKILVVEDDTSSRFILRKLLKHKGYDVYTAVNGKEALLKLAENNFDIVIADWLMPEMDGVELTKKIRNDFDKQPIVFILTAIALKEAKEKALTSGADEFLAKPLNSEALYALIENSLKREKNSVKIIEKKESVKEEKKFYCIAIAASAGGPPTLQRFFQGLDYCENAAFLIVQHGPQWMLETFAESLAKITTMSVKLGENGDEVSPGNIFIAPGEKHLVLAKDTLQIELLDGDPINFVKPAADPLFKSVALSFGSKSIGIVLTGMGKDGSVGCGFIRAAGGKIFVENPSTAILPSMPQSVILLGLADKILNVEELSGEIYRALVKK
ncbi:MAG: chemotaxis protein CheB [Chlorobi bacterium]|nr:chemotaxis protein CheB [Chlorobiota bacterium]